MTCKTAYEEGFRKAAEEAGIDPAILVKAAGLGSVLNFGQKAWRGISALGHAIKTTAQGVKGTKTLPQINRSWRAAKKVVKDVPGATKAVHGAKRIARWGAPAAAGFVGGRAASSNTPEQNYWAQQGYDPNMMAQFMAPGYDQLSHMRTADSIPRLMSYGGYMMPDGKAAYPGVFNARPYVPAWKRQENSEY